MPAGAGPAVAAPPHREDRLRAGDGRGGRRPPPDRIVHAVGDAAYVGEHLRDLDKQITWTSRLKVTSVLHDLAPPRTGQSGRPRTKGARLGTPTDLAATASWRTTKVRRYARTDTVQFADIVCLWYGSFHTQTVRVVLVRDSKPRTSDRDE
jgi:hypothetical protein